MKILCVVITLAFAMAVSAIAETKNDRVDIKEAALSYMDSWYKGDPKRMKQSLHKKLAKRSLQKSIGGNNLLGFTSASDMISYTRGGVGERLGWDGIDIKVVVLDHYKDIASVKIVTPHYYEYLHMIRIANEWRIINAVYQPYTPTAD